ncbi:hypothetical protein CDAR_76881 [Caerostris darwini]|uniref:Uncharacterized protein n=1 Tax=Caerostris darwini TaxID=1538125 RepID=A0AAV4QFJ7_9ARAC|nr:hypothetical protein CDAR_76881 [Caerostris darwini]
MVSRNIPDGEYMVRKGQQLFPVRSIHGRGVMKEPLSQEPLRRVREKPYSRTSVASFRSPISKEKTRSAGMKITLGDFRKSTILPPPLPLLFLMNVFFTFFLFSFY